MHWMYKLQVCSFRLILWKCLVNLETQKFEVPNFQIKVSCPEDVWVQGLPGQPVLRHRREVGLKFSQTDFKQTTNFLLFSCHSPFTSHRIHLLFTSIIWLSNSALHCSYLYKELVIRKSFTIRGSFFLVFLKRPNPRWSLSDNFSLEVLNLFRI